MLTNAPEFAQGITPPVTLFDLIEDIYDREGHPLPRGPEPEYYTDILPLLQRASLLTWVNSHASGGHGTWYPSTFAHSQNIELITLIGPSGRGNFFAKEWENDLSDKSADKKPLRLSILGKLRFPDVDEFKDLRTGQATTYFMPPLSGDDGKPRLLPAIFTKLPLTSLA